MSGPPPLTERIRQVEDRLHVLSALAAALEDPLATLALVAAAPDENAALGSLQERFGFDRGQARSVVDLQFRRASGRHRTAVLREHDEHASLLTDLQQALAQQQAVAAHYDARASTYDDSGMHRALAELVAEHAAGPGAGLVVDVATGTGLVLRSIAARHPEARLVGIDLSSGMLAVARAALPQAQLVQADASALPIPDRSVDLVTCVTALHLLAEPELAFDEWARVLRPGGRLVTATFAAATAHPTPSPRPDLPQGFARRHEDYRTPEQVGRVFRAHRLHLESHTEHRLDGDRLLVCVLRRTR